VTAVLALAMASVAILGDRSSLFALCAIIAWAAPAAAIATVLQTGITRAARPGTADIASSGYVVAFQIGIGAGAWTGGRFIDRGAYAVPLLITAGCAGLAAIAVALVHTASARPADPLCTRFSRKPITDNRQEKHDPRTDSHPLVGDRGCVPDLPTQLRRFERRRRR